MHHRTDPEPERDLNDSTPGSDDYRSEGENLADDGYDHWGGYQESSPLLKPLVIGLVVAFLLAGAVLLYLRWSTDPARFFDDAPLVNVIEEAAETEAGGVTADRAAKPAQPATTPAPAAEPAVASAEAPEPVAAPPEPAPPSEPATAEPTAEPPASPAAQPAAAPGEYAELLAAARQARGVAKRGAILRDAIAANPDGDEALAELALMLMESRKTRAEALELANRAAALNPDNGMAWLVVGYVNQLEGKRAEAKDAYRKCAESSGPKKYVVECKRLV